MFIGICAVNYLDDRVEQGILQNDPLALRKWDNEEIELNESQTDSIQRAIHEEFLLIRGPPGNGRF